MMKTAILAVFTALLLCSCVWAQGIDELTYINKRLGFTFSVPSYDWEIYPNMPEPMVFGGSNRITKARLAITFYENTEDEAPTFKDLEKLVEKTEKNNYAQTKGNYARVNLTEITIADKRALWLEYTYTEEEVDMHGIVVVFSTERFYFFCGIDVMERDFEVTLQDFHYMLDSIVL